MNRGTVIAFKCIKTKIWYTGTIEIYRSNSDFHVKLTMPIEPQWYEKHDKTHYHSSEIESIKILEP